MKIIIKRLQLQFYEKDSSPDVLGSFVVYKKQRVTVRKKSNIITKAFFLLKKQ